MTQKELAYVEDAIGHEQILISVLEESINLLEDENLSEYMRCELKTHKKQEKDLMKLLEDNVNE